MELFVNDEIKCRTVACVNEFNCLQGEMECLCKVTSMVNNNIMHVICLHENTCKYKHHVEDRTICTCPVRLEVYKKYNI